jgi:hypothetical protein
MHPIKTRDQCQTNRRQRQTWRPYKPATRYYKPSWNNHWPELSKTSRKTKTFPDHQEQSKLSRHWKRRLPFSEKNKHDPEYEVSEYATGNRCWKRSPVQHPVPIQDLLLYDIQNKHNQNKILGDKVAQVLRQDSQLAQQVSSAYETPSEKLKRDPIMGFVTKTGDGGLFLMGGTIFQKEGVKAKMKAERKRKQR